MVALPYGSSLYSVDEAVQVLLLMYYVTFGKILFLRDSSFSSLNQ